MDIKNKLNGLVYVPLALALLASCASDENWGVKTLLPEDRH